MYPDGAQRLAVFLARRLRETRNLKEVGWAAWLEGYPVTPFARGLLLDEIEKYEFEANHGLIPGEHWPHDPVDDLWPDDNASAPLFRALLLGREPTATAIERHARSKDSFPLLGELADIGRVINLDAARSAITQVTQKDLEDARDGVLLLGKVCQRLLRVTFPLPRADAVLFWCAGVASARISGTIERWHKVRTKFLTDIRHPSPDAWPSEIVLAFREARKELRRARRRAKLL